MLTLQKLSNLDAICAQLCVFMNDKNWVNHTVFTLHNNLKCFCEHSYSRTIYSIGNPYHLTYELISFPAIHDVSPPSLLVAQFIWKVSLSAEDQET